MDLAHWVPSAIAVVVLAGIATIGLGLYRIPKPFAVLTAVGRAVLQLTALSLVLGGILHDPVWVAVALGVMFIAAVFTASRRARASLRQTGPLAVAMVVGPVVVGLVVFGTGAIEFSPRYALAIGGIVIGNTMTIAILTERIFRTAVLEKWDEVEGWLALGATPRESTLSIARASIRTALLPSIDQTRTTGIVVLPGAFVGAIFGGASPAEAGRFQVIVLASILAAGVVTASTLLRFDARVPSKPKAIG